MTVHVTMLASSLPEGSAADERTHNYDDTESTTYAYALHPGGALLVYERGGGDTGVKVAFGPSSWESVKGNAWSGQQ